MEELLSNLSMLLPLHFHWLLKPTIRVTLTYIYMTMYKIASGSCCITQGLSSVLCDNQEGWHEGQWEGGSRGRGYIYVYIFYMYIWKVKWKCDSESRSVVSDSLQPYGLYSPRNSPGQNTGVGSPSLLQGIFPTQGSNPGLLNCRWIPYQLSHKGTPYIYIYTYL